MLSSDFIEKLRKFPFVKNCFSGVYAIDTIPVSLKKDHFFICNTDVSYGSGKHWFCVYKEKNCRLECFDSLGVDEQKRNILKTCLKQRGIKEIKFNVTRVQSLETTSCGQFVLYFIIERYHNKDLSFNELLNSIFVQSINENELKVNEFYQSHFSDHV